MTETICKMTVVDAFTSHAFGGNPAAVCLLDEQRPVQWMQHVAAEMNLSETAFVLRREDGTYDLRWFTPTTEVDLCGHATLASAHVLWQSGAAAAGAVITFQTRSGRLGARRAGDAIELDLPSAPDREIAAPAMLAEALGVRPRYVGRNRFDYVVECDSETIVRAMHPRFDLLATIRDYGFIATSNRPTATVRRYETSTRVWTEAAPLPTPRGGHAAAGAGRLTTATSTSTTHRREPGRGDRLSILAAPAVRSRLAPRSTTSAENPKPGGPCSMKSGALTTAPAVGWPTRQCPRLAILHAPWSSMGASMS